MKIDTKEFLTSPVEEIKKQVDEEIKDTILRFTSPLPKEKSLEIANIWSTVSFSSEEQVSVQENEEKKLVLDDETEDIINTIKSSKNVKLDESVENEILKAVFKSRSKKSVVSSTPSQTQPKLSKQELSTIKNTLGYSKINNEDVLVGIMDSRTNASPQELKSTNWLYNLSAKSLTNVSVPYGINVTEHSSPFILPPQSQSEQGQVPAQTGTTESNKLEYVLKGPDKILLSSIQEQPVQPVQTSQVNVTVQPEERLIDDAFTKVVSGALNVAQTVANTLSIFGSTVTHTLVKPLVISAVENDARKLDAVVKRINSDYKFIVTSSPYEFKVDDASRSIYIGQFDFTSMMSTLGNYGFVDSSKAIALWKERMSKERKPVVELGFSEVFSDVRADESRYTGAMSEYMKAPISKIDELDELYDKGIWGHSIFDSFEFVDKVYGYQKYSPAVSIPVSLIGDILTDPLVFIAPVKGTRVLVRSKDYILEGSSILDKLRRAAEIAVLSQKMTHDEYQMFKILSKPDVRKRLEDISAANFIKSYMNNSDLSYLGMNSSEELLTELRDSLNRIREKIDTLPDDKKPLEVKNAKDTIDSISSKLLDLSPDDFMDYQKIQKLISEIDNVFASERYNITSTLNKIIEDEVEYISKNYKVNVEKLSGVVDKLQQVGIVDMMLRSTKYKSIPVEYFYKYSPDGSDLVSLSDFMKVMRRVKGILIKIDEMTKDSQESLLRRAVIESLGLTREIIEKPEKAGKILGTKDDKINISERLFDEWQTLVSELGKQELQDVTRIFNSPDLANIVYVANDKYTVYNLMSRLATYADLSKIDAEDIVKTSEKVESAGNKLTELLANKVSDNAIMTKLVDAIYGIPDNIISTEEKIKLQKGIKAIFAPELLAKEIKTVQREHAGRKRKFYQVEVERLLKTPKPESIEMSLQDVDDISEDIMSRYVFSKMEESLPPDTGTIIEMSKGVMRRFLAVDFVNSFSRDDILARLKKGLAGSDLSDDEIKIVLEKIESVYDGIESARNSVVAKASELLTAFKTSPEAEVILNFVGREAVTRDPQISKLIDRIEQEIEEYAKNLDIEGMAKTLSKLLRNKDLTEMSKLAENIVSSYSSGGDKRTAIIRGISKLYSEKLRSLLDEEVEKIKEILVQNADILLIPSKEVVRRLYSELDELMSDSLALRIPRKHYKKLKQLVDSVLSGKNKDDVIAKLDELGIEKTRASMAETRLFNIVLWLEKNKEFREVLTNAKKKIKEVITGSDSMNLLRDSELRPVVNKLATAPKSLFRVPSISMWMRGLSIPPNKNITKYIIPGETTENEIEKMIDTILEVRTISRVDKILSIIGIGRDEIIKFARGVEALKDNIIPKTLNEKVKAETNFLKIAFNRAYMELSNIFKNKTTELNVQIGHTVAEVEKMLKESLTPLVAVNSARNDIVQRAIELAEREGDSALLELAKKLSKTDFGDLKSVHIITALVEHTDIFANSFMQGKKRFAELFVTDFLKNATNRDDLIRLIAEHDGGKALVTMGEALRNRLKLHIIKSAPKSYVMPQDIKPLDYIAFYMSLGSKEGDDIIESLKALSIIAELAVRSEAFDEFDKFISYFIKSADSIFTKLNGMSVYAVPVEKIILRAIESVMQDPMTRTYLEAIENWVNKQIFAITGGTPLHRAATTGKDGDIKYFKYISIPEDSVKPGFVKSAEYSLVMSDTELAMSLFQKFMTEQAVAPIEAVKTEQAVLSPLIPRIIASRSAKKQLQTVKEMEIGVKRELDIGEILDIVSNVEKEFALNVSPEEASIYHMLLSAARQSLPSNFLAEALGFKNELQFTHFIDSLVGKTGELGVKIQEIGQGGKTIITDQELNMFEKNMIEKIRKRLKRPIKLEKIFVQNSLLSISHKIALRHIVRETKKFLLNPSISKTLLVFGKSATQFQVGGLTEISKNIYIPFSRVISTPENMRVLEHQLITSETPITTTIINNPLYSRTIAIARKYSVDPTELIRASESVFKDYMKKVYNEGIKTKEKHLVGMDAVAEALRVFYHDTVSSKLGHKVYRSAFFANMRGLAEDYISKTVPGKIDSNSADKVLLSLLKPNGEDFDPDVELFLLTLKEKRTITLKEYQEFKYSQLLGQPTKIKGLEEKNILSQVAGDVKDIESALKTIVTFIMALKRGALERDRLPKSFAELESITKDLSSVLDEIKEDLPKLEVFKHFEEYVSELNRISKELVEQGKEPPLGLAIPAISKETLYDAIQLMNPYKSVGIYTYEKLIKEVKNLVLPFLELESYSEVMEKISNFLGVLRRSLITWFPSFYLQNLIDSLVKHFISGGSLSSVMAATKFLLNKFIDKSNEKLTQRTAKEILDVYNTSKLADKNVIIKFVEGDEKRIPVDELVSQLKSADYNAAVLELNRAITDIIGPRVVKEIELSYTENGKTVSKVLNSFDTIYNGYSLNDLYELALSSRLFNVGITLSVSQDTLRDDIYLLFRTFQNKMSKIGAEEGAIMKRVDKAKSVFVDTIRKMDMQRRILLRLNGTIEQIVRFAMFIDSIAEKGLSLPETIRRIDMWHFDYSTISKLEKKYLNNIFFFWTFFRKTFELVLRLISTKLIFVGHLIKSRYDMHGEAMEFQNSYTIPVGFDISSGIPKLEGIDLSRTFSILFPVALMTSSFDNLERNLRKTLIIKPAVERQIQDKIQTSLSEHIIDYTELAVNSVVSVSQPIIEQIVSMSNPLIKLTLLLGGYSLNFGQIKQARNRNELFYFFGTWLPVDELTTSLFSSVVRRNVFFGGASLETFLFPVSIRREKADIISQQDITQVKSSITQETKQMLTSLLSKIKDEPSEIRKEKARQLVKATIRKKLITEFSELAEKTKQSKLDVKLIKKFKRIMEE